MQRAVSLADQIFERLEHDILTGKYPRGSVLTELALCEDLKVSRTPIREALSRLEQEHLIESTPKGIVVVSITERDAEVIYAIRKQTEGLAAAACAGRITDESLKQLKENVELAEFYLAKGDSEKLNLLDNEFHSLIYAAAGSPVYYDTLMPLHTKIQKFREGALSITSRAEASIAEHRKIYEALSKHDPDLAEMAMYEHTLHAQKHMESAIKAMDREN